MVVLAPVTQEVSNRTVKQQYVTIPAGFLGIDGEIQAIDWMVKCFWKN